MTVERADPSRIMVAGGDESDVRRYIESDFKIRSGLCPNGCGLLGPLIDSPNPEWQGQECPACHFSTNVLAEKGSPQ